MGELKRLEFASLNVVGAITERLVRRSAAGAIIVGLTLLKLHLDGFARSNLGLAALTELGSVGYNAGLRGSRDLLLGLFLFFLFLFPDSLGILLLSLFSLGLLSSNRLSNGLRRSDRLNLRLLLFLLLFNRGG